MGRGGEPGDAACKGRGGKKCGKRETSWCGMWWKAEGCGDEQAERAVESPGKGRSERRRILER